MNVASDKPLGFDQEISFFFFCTLSLKQGTGGVSRLLSTLLMGFVFF